MCVYVLVILYGIRPVKELLCTYSRTLVWWHCVWGGRSLGKHLQFNYCIPSSPLLPFLTGNLSFYTLVQFHGIEKDFSTSLSQLLDFVYKFQVFHRIKSMYTWKKLHIHTSRAAVAALFLLVFIWAMDDINFINFEKWFYLWSLYYSSNWEKLL